jgi:hypothetical protein
VDRLAFGQRITETDLSSPFIIAGHKIASCHTGLAHNMAGPVCFFGWVLDELDAIYPDVAGRLPQLVGWCRLSGLGKPVGSLVV